MRWGMMAGAALALAGGLLACTAPDPSSRGLDVRTPTSHVQPPPEPLVPLLDLEIPPAETASRVEFPYLDGEMSGSSVSIGDTTHGRLVNGAELVESDALRILPKQKERDLRYGTAPLVALLTHASRALGEKTRSTLWIGNLGRKEGGDIEWSVSHNAGRDADVAFCYRDPATGKPVDPPDLVRLGKDGLSADRKLAFDPARTWLVVRAMLEFEGASLQYLFISDGLKKKLLEHAKAIKEPVLLVERAAEVLRQPGGAAAHDDHLHVRVYCSALDASGGCRDMGLTHSFARRFDDERAKGAQRARMQLGDLRPTQRRRALLRLGLVGEPTDSPLAVAALADSSADVRAAAATLLGVLGAETDTASLVQRFRAESDPAVLAALVDGIGLLGGVEAGPLFRDVLLATANAPLAITDEAAAPVSLVAGITPSTFFAPPEDSYAPLRLLMAPRPRADATLDRIELRKLVVRAARQADRLEPVEPLVALLDSADVSLAVDAASTLAYITNSRLLDASEARPLAARLKEAKSRYAQLLARYGPAPRDAWVVAGFGARGYQVRGIDRRWAWELLRAVADEPHVAYNGLKLLARLFGQPREVAQYGAGDGCRMMYGILSERRSELRLDRPNDAQRSACFHARNKEKELGN